MQNSDAPGGKEIQDLQQLWQQTTTTNSLKIKEREMVRDIQYQVDTFDEKFGMGTLKNSSMAGFMTIMFIFIATRDFMRDSKANIPFIILAIIQGILFLFHTVTRLQQRKYNMSNARDYFTYNLERVQRQLLWMKIIPLLVVPLFVAIYFYYPADQLSPIWITILAAIPIVGTGYFIWLYHYQIIPLRDKLQSALQQLNEH